MKSPIATAALSLALIGGCASFAAADSQREKAAANFTAADADADGSLTIDEFTRFIDLNAEDRLGDSRLVQRTGRYQMAFERVDANADGLVAAEELAAAASR